MNLVLPKIHQTAREQAAQLGPLLAEARQLAAMVVAGSHGRRQAGAGEEFWQFRNAEAGDSWRAIDWRRSARSDAHYIRQQEWQAAQSVVLWIDSAKSMEFSGDKKRPHKKDRARVLGLATAIGLVRAGERVGLIGDPEPPKSGEKQIDKMIAQMGGEMGAADYGVPDANTFPKRARAVFLSDFLGDIDAVKGSVYHAADRGVRGALVHILDPVEEQFPFDGRTVFESMGRSVRFETLRARGLKDAYQSRLAARKVALAEIARAADWQILCHHTDSPAQTAMIWLRGALGEVR